MIALELYLLLLEGVIYVHVNRIFNWKSPLIEIEEEWVVHLRSENTVNELSLLLWPWRTEGH